MLDTLPADVIVKICTYCSSSVMEVLANVCLYLKIIINDEVLWRIRCIDDLFDSPSALVVGEHGWRDRYFSFVKWSGPYECAIKPVATSLFCGLFLGGINTPCDGWGRAGTFFVDLARQSLRWVSPHGYAFATALGPLFNYSQHLQDVEASAAAAAARHRDRTAHEELALMGLADPPATATATDPGTHPPIPPPGTLEDTAREHPPEEDPLGATSGSVVAPRAGGHKGPKKGRRGGPSKPQQQEPPSGAVTIPEGGERHPLLAAPFRTLGATPYLMDPMKRMILCKLDHHTWLRITFRDTCTTGQFWSRRQARKSAEEPGSVIFFDGMIGSRVSSAPFRGTGMEALTSRDFMKPVYLVKGFMPRERGAAGFTMEDETE
ncbi:hypothetical protein PAPYR_3689 [Paratrimastix pyriformis]|uniref:F-box domain-containing protein n=1 Tax=Paratrimastix pyriformis TaxID=342808 RepID=A0ABQ8UM82_9EUKA|nr:hypothetical protein PAPYR_3689 [Paratrimastix pyriformis]